MINWRLNHQLIKISTKLLSGKPVNSYYFGITITSCYYELPTLLITIRQTDTPTNRLTDLELYKMTDWLFNWSAKESEIDRLCNLSTTQLTPWSARHLEKISNNLLSNRSRHQLNDSKISEIQAIYINSKYSVIRWQEPLTLWNFFKFAFFSDRASHLLTN